jgi:hypothetical protein
MIQSGVTIQENSRLGPNKAPFGITNPVKFGTNSADLSIGGIIAYDSRVYYIGSWLTKTGTIPALFPKETEDLRYFCGEPELSYYEIDSRGLLLLRTTQCQAVTEQILWCGISSPNFCQSIMRKIGLSCLVKRNRYYTFDISGKSSSARNALFTVMDSGIGDVGYFGPLTLELYAANPVIIYAGSVVAQVRFFEVEGPQEKLYVGYDTKTFDRAPQPKPIPVREEFLVI